MKLIHFLRIIIANLFLCFTLICNAETLESASDMNTYSESKLNISITSVQPQFIIRLKSNPTTGYSWFLSKYDRHLIRPIKHSFEVPRTNIIGAPATEVWIFRVNSEGFVVPQQTRIRFIYARPWQGEENSKQMVFYVTVKK